MYVDSEIKTGLYQLVGWKQPSESGYNILDADNLVSNSGKRFEDYHPLVKVKYIKDSQDDASISDANFNTYLKDLQKSCIVDAVNAVLPDKDLIDHDILFPYENRLIDLIENTTSFVGYEITSCKDIGVIVNQLITEFNGIGTFNLYLFHSSQKAPVKTQSVTTQAYSSKYQTLSDWKLDSRTYKGGTWYIGYLRSGLTIKAINRQWDLSGVKNNFKAFNTIPFIVRDWNSAELWDIDDIEYTSETFGLNFDFSSRYEYTNKVLTNKDLFRDAIGYRMATKVLELIATSSRINGNETLANMALTELEEKGESFYKGGLRKQYEDEINKLKKIMFPEPKIMIL